MSNARLELGGGNWAVKNDGVGGRNLLGYAVGDTSGKYIARDFYFSRAGDIASTRVNKDGLVEKYRENLLLQSNQFDTTWTANSASRTGGQAGYDGSNDAWELKATGDGVTNLARVTQTISLSGVSTFSVYAKAGNVSWVRLNALTSGTNVNNYFDLSGSGAVGASPSSTVIESTITSVGNGWFRISVASKGQASISEVRIQVAEADGDDIPATNSYIYIQDAQLESGLVATDYLESGSTTGKAGVLDDLPRIDYKNGSAQLLMEPSRTNYVDQSEYFGDWTASGSTVTDNNTTSPEGLLNASKLQANFNASSVNHQIDAASATIPSGAVSASIFAKKGNTDFVRLRLSGTTNAIRAWFDLSNGTTGTVDGGGTSSITSMGDGWYRCTVTEAGNTNTTAALQVFINESDGQTTWVADGNEYIYIYGAQLEAGSFATSYIPTYGSTDTRPVEVCNNFDDIQIGNSYTVLFDFDLTNNPVDNTIAFQMNNSSGTTSFTARWHGSTDGFRIYNNIDTQYPLSTYSSSTKKWVLRIDGTSFDLFHNDSGTTTKRTGTAMTTARDLDEFQLKGIGTHLNNIKIFDSALSDSECNALIL
jgi:hypothetical protein